MKKVHLALLQIQLLWCTCSIYKPTIENRIDFTSVVCTSFFVMEWTDYIFMELAEGSVDNITLLIRQLHIYNLKRTL